MTPEAELGQPSFEDRVRSSDYTMADVRGMITRALDYRELFSTEELVDPYTGSIITEEECSSGTTFSFNEVSVTRADDYDAELDSFDLGLNERENVLMRHIWAGSTVGQVARIMGLSKRTIHVWQRELFNKIGAKNRAHCMRIAVEEGLFDLEVYNIDNVRLTARELETLELISHGLDIDQIAAKLAIAKGTVIAHKRSLYARLKVTNASNAVVEGFMCGFLVPEQDLQEPLT